MPYHLKEDKRIALLGHLGAGYSIRMAARIVGCANSTALRYAASAPRGNCPCGLAAGHRGWCSWRFLQSPARQEYMRKWAESRRAAVRERALRSRPLAEYWPFIDVPLDDMHRLLVRIGEVIPRSLSEEVRREVGQDIALALFSGEIQEVDLAAVYPTFLRGAYQRLPSRWQTISLDAPFGRDERPLSERLALLSEAWRGTGEALHFRASTGEEVWTERPDDGELPDLAPNPPPPREPRPRLRFFPHGHPQARLKGRTGSSARLRTTAAAFEREGETAPHPGGRVWVCP